MIALRLIYIILIPNLFYVPSVISYDFNSMVVKALRSLGFYHDNNLKAQNSISKASNDKQCGVSNYNSFERIVGGEVAKPHEFPWQVSIQVNVRGKYIHNCGGAVVHPQFVLTAAHCTNGVQKDKLLIVAGIVRVDVQEENGQSRSASKIFTNNYNEDNFSNDIAIINVNDSFIFNDYVTPICLPEGKIKFKEIAVVAGWGRVKEDGEISKELLKVVLNLISSERCKNIYKEKGYDYFLHDCQICTLDNKKDSCQGDSGGPLLCLNDNTDDNKVYICGIVSWGAGCAKPNNPGVYTEVSCFIQWIKDIIDKKTKN